MRIRQQLKKYKWLLSLILTIVLLAGIVTINSASALEEKETEGRQEKVTGEEIQPDTKDSSEKVEEQTEEKSDDQMGVETDPQDEEMKAEAPDAQEKAESNTTAREKVDAEDEENEENPVVSAEAGGSVNRALFPDLTGDTAYVKSLEITNITDGTAPWDTTKAPGNDQEPDNNIVRSFDSVTYMFSAEMDTYTPGDVYGKARVKLEVVLPMTFEQGEFDLGAMAWMDTSAGYAPVVTTESRNIEGQMIECQVLTCYNLLSSDVNPVIPGDFGQPVSIKVKKMANGDTVKPIFSAAFEHSTWSDSSCTVPGHLLEKRTVVADAVKVSAAPKYNVSLMTASESVAMWGGSNDYNTGNASGSFPAANYGIGNVSGRTQGFGITIMLYNDNASKGIKGIELPQGAITLDVTLSSVFRPNSGGSIDVSEGAYRPLLWAYGPNDASSMTPDGRVDASTSHFAYGAAPYGSGTGVNQCYNGGKWSAKQTGKTISITVSDYVINMNHFPDRFGGNIGPDGTYGQSHIGMFSAGEIWIQQPFDKIGTVNTSGVTDIVKEYGSGTFALTVSDVNLKMMSISGQPQNDAIGTNNAQINKNDDRKAVTVYLTRSGTIDNRAYYTLPTNTNLGEYGTNGQYSYFANGRDSALTGADIILASGFNYTAMMYEENRFQYGISLMKFDGSAITLTGNTYVNTRLYGAVPEVLYATKTDGSNWDDDEELKKTEEDALVYYASLDEIPPGHICVAALIRLKGPATTLSNISPYVGLSAKVSSDQSLVGNVLMLYSRARVWTTTNLQKAGMSLDEVAAIDWIDPNTSLDDYPPGYLSTQAYNYTKESYDENGPKGTHSGDFRQGDSLLILGYKTAITKNLAQTLEGGSEKDTYNLDLFQRVADFILQPAVNIDGDTPSDTATTTITITDTLPKYLKYKPGSGYFGGNYSQSSAAGGTPGNVTGGVPAEPVSIDHADGTQTLTWVIPDVEVGKPMKPIYYSVDIGRIGDEANDVPIATTSLVNKVGISGTDDNREKSIENGNYAEVGLRVVRGTATSFAKFTDTPVVDPDGIASYTILYANNAATPEHKKVLLDTMPYNGDLRGSIFSGTYTVSGLKIDKSLVPTSSLQVWYTTNAYYRDSIASSVSYDSITNSGGTWIQAPIAADGTVTGMNGLTPVAWAVVGTLNGGETIRADLSIQLSPTAAKEGDAFVNMLSQGDKSTNVKVNTVSHTLEGLTWLDKNQDGIQDDETIETLLSGVKVTLLQLKEGGNPDKEADYTEVLSVMTGKAKDLATGAETWHEPGHYKFTNLPDGIFAVRFDNGGTAKIADYTASPVNAGSDETIDSDGSPAYNPNSHMLVQTVIKGIFLPAAEQMTGTLFESKYHDSGFYETIGYSFTKIIGTDTSKPLKGAEFVVYKSNHIHDETCGGLSLDGECSFVTQMQEGDVFDQEVWNLDTPVCTVTSDENGKVELTGLGPGIYMLVETKAPDGYELSSGSWILDVDPADLTNPVTISGSPISPSAAEGQPNAFLVEESDGVKQYFLPNYRKMGLPSAGGRWMIFFTSGGIILAGVAILLFLLRKRESIYQFRATV